MTIELPNEDTPEVRLSARHHESDMGTGGSYERDLRILAELLLEIYLDRQVKSPAQPKADGIDEVSR